MSGGAPSAGQGPTVWPPRRRRLALGARLAVLLTAATAVAGFVTTDLRLGGLGYAIVLVPVAVVAVALGLLGAPLLGAPGPVRLVVGLVLTTVAVVVLLLIGVAGLATPSFTPS